MIEIYEALQRQPFDENLIKKERFRKEYADLMMAEERFIKTKPEFHGLNMGT